MTDNAIFIREEILRSARHAYTSALGRHAQQDEIIRAVVAATLRTLADQSDRIDLEHRRFGASYDDSASEDAIPISPAG